ncbi:MAG: tetratricopeptide repeat protein [Gemmatimonadota bacterium]
MSRVRMILTLVALGSMVGALPASAQKPSDNRYTRGVALYISQARQKANPDDKKKLFQQAIDLAQDGMSANANNPRLYLLLGRAYAELNQVGEAAGAWDRAIELYPEYEEELSTDRHNAWVRAYNAGATASQQGDMETAEAHYRGADKVFQGRPEAKLNLGTMLAAEGEDEESVTFFQGALEIMDGPEGEKLREANEEAFDNNRRVAVFNMAQVLARSDRGEEAVQAYRDYLEINPEDMTALGNLGVVLGQLGQTDEVAELYAGALERDDLSGDEYFRLGVGLFGAERYEEARTAFAKSLDKNPHSRDTRYNMANSVYALARAIEERLVEAGAAPEGDDRDDLATYYGELREQAGALREMDPYNENILALAAQAVRSLSDLEADEAAADALRQETANILERRAGLAFSVEGVDMEVDDDFVILSGTAVNIAGAEGDPATLRFVVVDEDGVELTTGEVALTLPAEDGSTPWELELPFDSETRPAGWRYEVAE